MNGISPFSHSYCRCSEGNYTIEFGLYQWRKGEKCSGVKGGAHQLVFLLEGELQCSYNEYVRYWFREGEFFFIPQGSCVYWEFLSDSRLLVLRFDNGVDELLNMSVRADYQRVIEVVKYDFGALPISRLVKSFVSLMEFYLKDGIRESNLQWVKQRELFILLQHAYTPHELLRMFYPALGKGDFHTWVLQNYQPGVTMAELASRCNMTSKSFSRRFNARFGKTFRQWMLEQKVVQVRMRLSIKDVSLKDIVREFDFYSLSHLSRFCKQNLGNSPSVLRRQLLGRV